MSLFLVVVGVLVGEEGLLVFEEGDVVEDI